MIRCDSILYKMLDWGASCDNLRYSTKTRHTLGPPVNHIFFISVSPALTIHIRV